MNRKQLMKKSFAFTHRNPGHWDVSDKTGRIFAIRGEPGKVFVRDESGQYGNTGKIFEDALDAAKWVVLQLTNEDLDHRCLGCGEEDCCGACAYR